MKVWSWDGNRKSLLSVLWIFLTANYIYCDVFTLHQAKYLEAFLSGQVGDMVLTESFLLIYAAIMQIPMLMIVLSKVLADSLNRYANLIAGSLTTLNQAYTVMMGGSLHFMFFSVFEIATGLGIIYLAIRWKPHAM